MIDLLLRGWGLLSLIVCLGVVGAIALEYCIGEWRSNVLYVDRERRRAEREIDRIGRQAEARIMAEAVRRVTTPRPSGDMHGDIPIGAVARGRAYVRGNHYIDGEVVD